MKIISLHKQAIHTGHLILVNSQYGSREPELADLTAVSGSGSDIQLNRRAAVLLSELMKKINGWKQIVPVSGWRSFKTQQAIWDNSLAENGLEFTRKYVAFPGHSEHQTGLAIDLGLRQAAIDWLCPAFPYSGIAQTFRQHAVEYGFIERYPSGKESITGIGHEPWHFRYVGIPHALIMTEHHFTLEEYIAFLRNYPYQSRPYLYRNRNLYVMVSFLKAAQNQQTFLELNAQMPYSVSGNNIDGFIITEWRRKSNE